MHGLPPDLPPKSAPVVCQNLIVDISYHTLYIYIMTVPTTHLRTGYEPGIRGYLAFLRLGDILRDGDGINWRTLASRARPSARLRQSEQERRYWRSKVTP